MLKQIANVSFNHDAQVSWMMRGMKKAAEIHPQMQRLYLAAKVLRETEGKAAVGRLLNVSDQRLNGWEARGIAHKEQPVVAAALGCGLAWLRDNIGEMTDGAATTAGNLQDVVDLVTFYGRLNQQNRELVLRFARSLLPEA